MVIRINQVSSDTVRYLRRRLLYWGRMNFCNFPWRHETNQFHALIAEVLLQRTKAEQVVAVYQEFKERFPEPSSLSIATVHEIEAIIASLGLRWRARFLSELGKKLADRGGNIPIDFVQLQDLPGVGPYAAAAYLSLHRGERVPILDSNVVRFYGRFFGFDTGPETRRDKTILELAEHITPKRAFTDFNYGLIDFTRAICKPKPNHETCPVADRCSFYRQ